MPPQSRRRNRAPKGRGWNHGELGLIGSCGHNVDYAVTVVEAGMPGHIQYLCEACQPYQWVKLIRKPRKRTPRAEVDGQEELPPF